MAPVKLYCPYQGASTQLTQYFVGIEEKPLYIALLMQHKAALRVSQGEMGGKSRNLAQRAKEGGEPREQLKCRPVLP